MKLSGTPKRRPGLPSEITVHVHHHGLSPDQGEILRLLRTLTRHGAVMSQELDALKAEVARNTEVDESAMALIAGLANRIEELKADPAALQAMADELRAKNTALAAAVAANTQA